MKDSRQQVGVRERWTTHAETVEDVKALFQYAAAAAASAAQHGIEIIEEGAADAIAKQALPESLRAPTLVTEARHWRRGIGGVKSLCTLVRAAVEEGDCTRAVNLAMQVGIETERCQTLSAIAAVRAVRRDRGHRKGQAAQHDKAIERAKRRAAAVAVVRERHPTWSNNSVYTEVGKHETPRVGPEAILASLQRLQK
jgi:hypothetical protein